MNQKVAQSGGFDRTSENRPLARIGGELVQGPTLRAAANDMDHLQMSARRFEYQQPNPLFFQVGLVILSSDVDSYTWEAADHSASHHHTDIGARSPARAGTDDHRADGRAEHPTSSYHPEEISWPPRLE